MMSWERVGKHGTADPELNWHKPAGVGTNVWSAMPVIGAHRISREVVSCQSLRQTGQSHGRVAPGSVLRKGAGSRVAQEGLSMLCEIEHNMDYAELLIMRNESAEAFCRVDSGSVNSA